MTIIDQIERAGAGEQRELPTCSDFDEDCPAVEDKLHCYLYDPAKGMCPYLRNPQDTGA